MNHDEGLIELAGRDLPRRLRRCRERRRLSMAQLAARSGLTYRTILDLERSRRERVEKLTLLRLADALGCTPADLLEGPDGEAGDKVGAEAGGRPVEEPGRESEPEGERAAPRRSALRRALPLAAPLGALALAAGLLAVSLERRPAIEDGDLVVRGGLLGRELWRLDADAPVGFWADSPWHDGRILAGLGKSRLDGGRLLLLEGRTGRLVWEFSPDLELASRAFGPEIFDADNRLHISTAYVADLDGDGTAEVLAPFGHPLYYPLWLSLLDREGRHLGTYMNRGCIYSHLACDLDEDGRQELLVGGTNNSKALQGATVLLLDWECHTGVALDTVSGDTACLPDSARIRLVLPSFGDPWMDLIRAVRLETRELALEKGPAGEPRIVVTLAFQEPICRITLDRDLRPLAAEPCAWIIQRAAAWPAPHTGGGPADREWLKAWLGRALRVEAGHYPPGPCEPQPPALSSR